MSCSSPLLAVDNGFKADGITRDIKLIPRRVDYSYEYLRSRYGDKLMMLPCGSCDACIFARRKMWALRCYAESLYHTVNCLVTLTYDDDHLPSDGKLQKRDFQAFIKSIRNSGFKVRYYGVGEYGGLTGRPHYHLILFGFFPDDAKFHSMTKSGFYQFTSRFLSDLWGKGFCTVSNFTPEVAGYVAGYVDKKYKQRDCFSLMSKKPGLGEQYFYDHFDKFYECDSIVMKNGSIGKVPRYFDKLAELIGVDISDVKAERLDMANYQMFKEMRSRGFVAIEQLNKFNEGMFKDKLNRKKRGL